LIFADSLRRPAGKQVVAVRGPLALDAQTKTSQNLFDKPCRIAGGIRKRAQRSFPAMLVGSMRVASDNDRQTTDVQRDALLDAGVERSAG